MCNIRYNDYYIYHVVCVESRSKNIIVIEFRSNVTMRLKYLINSGRNCEMLCPTICAQWDTEKVFLVPRSHPLLISSPVHREYSV